MKAYRKKQEEIFVPVVLELETQAEVDFVRAVFERLHTESTALSVIEDMSLDIVDGLNTSSTFIWTTEGVERFKALLNGITL